MNALGSTEVITDAAGNEVLRQAFGPFGQLRGPAGGGGTGVLSGFTGHSQDTELGLVDMGGRVYDGAMGRFLTPDPIIAAPFWSQGLNPYSYVFNNPTNFIDPSGFTPDDRVPDNELRDELSEWPPPEIEPDDRDDPIKWSNFRNRKWSTPQARATWATSGPA